MLGKRLVAGGVIFMLLAAGTAYKLYHKTETGIVATGLIEVTKADITPKVGGYISELSLQVGDSVQSGQKVAVIVRADLNAQVLRDEAALLKAETQLKEMLSGSRYQERQEVMARVESLQSVYEKAENDYTRFRKLYQEGAISAYVMDGAQSSLEVSRSNLSEAKQKLSLVEEGPRAEAIDAQRAEVERNRAILEASRVAVRDTAVMVPVNGLILSKSYENNEYINPGMPIAVVGDMNDCWVKVYIPSPQLGMVKIGQEAKVKIDGFENRTFLGTIKEISQNAEFTPRQSITSRERATQVFAVKIKLDNREGILKPGMPADVVLQ